MKLHLPESFRMHPDVGYALSHGKPVVALESAVITHGLPRPVNLELALMMESIIREQGAIPATVAMLDGVMVIGVANDELTRLAESNTVVKVSPRNIGIGISQKLSGGTTVAATLFAARTAGIRVFATGGIGGVHRGNPFDVSADLTELAQSPVIVVCAGAKAILDLPATLEALETRGVPVLGYQTNDFPAFYTRISGLGVDFRMESAQDAYEVARAHWDAGSRSAVLVCNPIPAESELDKVRIDDAIDKAVESARRKGINSAALTPYLLEKLNQATSGKSLKANLALLQNNARLAAEIAGFFARSNLVTY